MVRIGGALEHPSVDRTGTGRGATVVGAWQKARGAAGGGRECIQDCEAHSRGIGRDVVVGAGGSRGGAGSEGVQVRRAQGVGEQGGSTGQGVLAGGLVLRTNLDGSEPKYYLSNAPAHTPLLELGQVGALRWTVETELQTSKGETGLDEYEVRGWTGWHHHITLALLAGAFLLNLQQEWGEKDAPDHPPTSKPSAAPTAAQKTVQPRGVATVAPRHPAAQRALQTLPHQT